MILPATDLFFCPSAENRFTPIYDFGYVALVMNWVFGEDSGEYLCRATNKWGMDETRATLKATGRPGVIYESQIPKGMQSLEKIRELEASWSQYVDDFALCVCQSLNIAGV